MARLAQSQAEYCARVGKLVHSNKFAFQGGENLAQGGSNFTPRAIVDCWLRSKAGHREYLLSHRVTKSGIGIAKSRGKTFVAWAFSDKRASYPDCPYYKGTKIAHVKPHAMNEKPPKSLAFQTSKHIHINIKQLVKRQRIIGRIIGLIFSALAVSLLVADIIGGAIGQKWQTTILPVNDLPGVILWTVVGGIALSGSILSKQRVKLGGIILVSCSAAMILGFINTPVWAIFGIPYLSAGVLLLISLRLTK